MVSLSHSNIHLRQALFNRELRRQGAEVLEVFPSSWGSLKRDGGFKVSFDGFMALYTFGEDALKAITDFDPDVMYVAAEWWSKQAYLSLQWAKSLGTKFVPFTWENLRQPSRGEEEEVLRKANLIVCGNLGAVKTVSKFNDHVVRLPQCGVDTSLFKPILDIPKKHDLLYVGRVTPEKGVEYIRGVAEKFNLEVEFVSGVPYEKLPRIYNSAKVFISFSYSTPNWVEQFNYTNVEALACGVPVVTSICGAIPEWLSQTPCVIMVQEKDVWQLEKTLKLLFSKEIEPCLKGSEWVEHNLSNRVIATQLLEAFRTVLC